MRILSTLLFAVFISLNISASSVSVISDFDDTIKRSNIPNIWPRGVANTILWRKSYTGMPELLNGLESEINGLYVLSASPKVIKPFIKALLKKYQISYDDIFTRNILATEEKIAYKMNRIESVLAKGSDKLILIGDDVEADQEVYLKISEKHPDRVEEIYIHNVVNREVPAGVTSFFTPYDIAVSEYKKGRLNYDQVEIVANSIINTKIKKMYRVIPKYAYCPTEVLEFNYLVPEDLEILTAAVNMKIIAYCLARNVD